MDVIIELLLAALFGAFGGIVYAIVNHLFASKDTYFSALEHVLVGGVVGLALVLVLGYQLPTTLGGGIPFIAAGYAGLDVIQLVAAKLNAAKTAVAPKA